ILDVVSDAVSSVLFLLPSHVLDTMAEPAAAAAGGDKPKSKKLLLIIVALLVVLIGGVAAFFLLKGGAHEEAEDEPAQPAKAPPKKKAPAGPPTFMALEMVVVNLADQGSTRYAQVGVTLQVEDDKVAEEVKKYMPAIRNGVLMLVSRSTADQLLSAEGKERLARDILELVRSTTGMEEYRGYSPVQAVLFSSFIVQ
ncbi:MAG: flagellar basal body-associated FliL family protein, partial [Tepidimonas sp.]|uniref:flagellar basal body-associated FliL family protein n=1 Tax=Tepidimonas sp. TaxID=2002775 RepID=UPI004054F25E